MPCVHLFLRRLNFPLLLFLDKRISRLFARSSYETYFLMLDSLLVWIWRVTVLRLLSPPFSQEARYHMMRTSNQRELLSMVKYNSSLLCFKFHSQLPVPSPLRRYDAQLKVPIFYRTPSQKSPVRVDTCSGWLAQPGSLSKKSPLLTLSYASLSTLFANSRLQTVTLSKYNFYTSGALNNHLLDVGTLQTADWVWINLFVPVFSHNQLYVTLSRDKSFENLEIWKKMFWNYHLILLYFIL